MSEEELRQTLEQMCTKAIEGPPLAYFHWMSPTDGPMNVTYKMFSIAFNADHEWILEQAVRLFKEFVDAGHREYGDNLTLIWRAVPQIEIHDYTRVYFRFAIVGEGALEPGQPR